jgi:rare lipoprotein A (peptidoglycan hydrolase)
VQGQVTVASAPVPKQEPASRTGNQSSYVVFGRRYRVLPTSEGYRERGIASWYGPGFHRRRTSSGDKYDMYAVSAAHKHLPIPTYARVTNLENGQSLVVRVNDRGPFVGERIIDLSYGAATQLGMAGQGTALVEVEALAPYQTLPGYGLEPGVRLAERVRPARPLRAERSRLPAPVVAQAEPPLLARPEPLPPLQLVSFQLDVPRPIAKVRVRTAPSPVPSTRLLSRTPSPVTARSAATTTKPTKTMRAATAASVVNSPSLQSRTINGQTGTGPARQGATRKAGYPASVAAVPNSRGTRDVATGATARLKPAHTRAGCSGRSCSTR